MRRSVKVATVVAAGMMGSGYLIAQMGGTPPALAAAKHAKTHARSTAAASAKPRATSTATGTKGPANATPHADGKVTAVNGNTITVQPDNDPAGSNEYTKVTTIVLTDTTTYQGSTTKASIVVGATIIAEGTVSSDGTTLTATSVGVGGHGGGHGGHGGGGPHADGTVTAVSGNTITVKADNDPAGSTEYTKVTTIVLTDSTTYGRNTTKASIVVGANIVAEGTLSSDGTTLTATRIDVHGNGG